jgi:hypothetical protein
LREIAAAFGVDPGALAQVNDWIWSGPDGVLGQSLKKNDEVNIQDPDFIPILAARFAAEALSSMGLSAEARSQLIQRLVPLALSNPAALDTVLARLMLSAIARHVAVPPILRGLNIRDLNIPVPLQTPASSEQSGSKITWHV